MGRCSGKKLGYIPCGYCFGNWATTWDHLLPWSRGGQTVDSNLYPSCRRCNQLLGAKLFHSIEEKREFVRDELIRRGKWTEVGENNSLPNLLETIREETPAPEILQPKVPLRRMVEAENRGNEVKKEYKPPIYRGIYISDEFKLFDVVEWRGFFYLSNPRHGNTRVISKRHRKFAIR